VDILVHGKRSRGTICKKQRACSRIQGHVPDSAFPVPRKAAGEQDRHGEADFWVEVRGFVCGGLLEQGKGDDGNFLLDSNLFDRHGEFVLGVAFWKYHANNAVSLVQAPPGNNEQTCKRGEGRDWIVNGDGTISCKPFPDLVLGCVESMWDADVPVKLVERGDPMQCVFEGIGKTNDEQNAEWDPATGGPFVKE